ncbi:MAG: serine/threonine protein kinase [Myxococcales bacterium]|nr:serine/threonine protein kinase [Myxococcales bacterium]
MDGNQLVGRVLAGRYKLLKLIGQGGMGSVFQGTDSQMSNRVVAIKILASHLVADEKQVARFEQEARAANQLRHPNTISVIDFGQSEGLIYMVMEYLTGETLTVILRQGQCETARCLYMIRQVLKSLAEAHSKGIIHRDLKPDNIFVCEIYGEKDFIKVIDFGIAKFLESGGQELTQAGKMFGTPRYLSPEQAQGLPLSAASDLYSLGVILFEMLSGRPPFLAEDPIAVAIKHVQEAPPTFADVAPNLYVPEELDHLVFKMLAKKAAQRFQSAEEVLEAIDRAMVALGSPRHPSGQFSAVHTRTPGHPITMPPPNRRSQPPPSKPADADADATRTLDTLNSGSEPAATMAMDIASPQPATAGANAATMALDTLDAAAHLQASRNTKGSRAAPSVRVAADRDQADPAQSGTQRLLLLLVIAIVLIGGAIAAVVLTRPPASADASVADQAKNDRADHAKNDKLPKAEAAAAADEPKDKAQVGAEERASAGAKGEKSAASVDKADDPAAAAAKADQPPLAPVAAGAVPAVTGQPAVGKPAVEVIPKMVITSKPDGATVLQDGKDVGKTPFTAELTAGKFLKLRLKKDGFDPFEIDFATLAVLQPTKPLFEATLTASKSAIKKVVKKPKWDM